MIFFIERRRVVVGEGGERDKERKALMGEKNTDWLPPVHAWAWEQTVNLGICPDWESNPQPFSVRDNAPTNRATWSGQMVP